MKSILLASIFCLAAIPLAAQSVSISKDQQQPFEPFKPSELEQRYPKGKTWQSLSVLRVNGHGSSQRWGIKGESQFIQANLYQTEIKILENNQFGKTSTIRLRLDVIKASSSKVVTKQTLRLADFEAKDPLFDFAIHKGIQMAERLSPSFKIAITVLKKWEEIDPDFQLTMTEAAKRFGMPMDQMGRARDLEWMETPRAYSGCSFEVQWVNGIGVTEALQIDSSNTKVPKLSEDDLKRWLVGANPLAELYVFPSLEKRIGDSWPLDASRATSVFSGQGDATSVGEIRLRYESDDTYDGNPVRILFIQNGSAEVITKSDGKETRYKINSMKGTMKVDNRDAMLRMSNGTGAISFSQMSTDHFLFKAELRRDVAGEWRYEAKRTD